MIKEDEMKRILGREKKKEIQITLQLYLMFAYKFFLHEIIHKLMCIDVAC